MRGGKGPPSGVTRVRRYRIRRGFGPAFTRLDVVVLQIGLIKDCGSFVELVERVLRGGAGQQGARRIHWCANPSRRLFIDLPPEEAAKRMAEAPAKISFVRSALRLSCGRVTLVEFDDPLEDEQFLELGAAASEPVEPPEWASEDVTHDPSTEPYQVAVNYFRDKLNSEQEDGVEELLRKPP